MKYRLLIGLLFTFILVPFTLAQQPNQVALVIALEGGLTIHRCVEFAEEQISGFEALNRSGLVVEAGTGSLGTAVCRIEQTGCAANDCFCQCKGGGDCRYWSYWHFLDGEWVYSQAGSASYSLKNGDIEGWTWGAGSVEGAVEPPVVTFEEVCSTEEVVNTQLPVLSVQLPGESTPSPMSDIPLLTTEENSFFWGGYVIFGLVVAGLGLLLIRRRR